MSGTFVLLLFFAGGVYSQVEQGLAVQDSIQRGLSYLDAQPHFDSELFVLYLINQKSNQPELANTISSKASLTDDFHYPIKQFVQGQTIEENNLSEHVTSDPYYPHFIAYFTCKPLTIEWIDQLSSLSDNEMSSYRSSHALLFLSLIKQDYFGGRCGDNPSLSTSVDAAIQLKSDEVQSGLTNRENFDSWVERVAVLEFSNYPVSQEDIDFIISKQSANGGWAPADFDVPFEEERSHTTALAVWALVEASK